MNSFSTSLSEARTEQVVTSELLGVRGWNDSPPPRGHVLRQAEFRRYPELAEALKGKSKKGVGDGLPDFLIVDPQSLHPLMVIEAKRDAEDIREASREAEDYANAFLSYPQLPLAVGVAGNRETEFEVHVSKSSSSGWQDVTHAGSAVRWLPSPNETHRLLADPSLFKLDPQIPSQEVLAQRADQINRILRECSITDSQRPAVVGAFMLGLWKSQGKITTDPETVLFLINRYCQKAFEDVGKPNVAEALQVPIENEALANRAHQIIYIFRLLDVTTLRQSHDYLGQLYECFFQYTGGNTIGQYFTPRHIAKFMADMLEVSENDRVLDPTCGTGGFLIASLTRMTGERELPKRELTELVQKHLFGIESEPITAALAIANMILRGDGATGITKADSLTDRNYPRNSMTVVLGNPPFPHRATDVPPDKFVDRGLEALQSRGMLAMIVPSSLTAKDSNKRWRESVLKKNTLRAVIKLPDELFRPFASSYSDIVVIEKGRKHTASDAVFFGYVQDDGFRMRKNVRVNSGDGVLPDILQAFKTREDIPGLCSFNTLKDLKGGTWSPGYFISAGEASDEEILAIVEKIARGEAAFRIAMSDKLAAFSEALKEKRFSPTPYRDIATNRQIVRSDNPDAISNVFDIYYGQRSLHSKEHLTEGEALIVSSSGENNGCYGFFNFDELLEPPFITAPANGTIGMACVQQFPCGVSDDCLVLLPRENTAPEELWIGAAVIRRERWRFHYGYKLTPKRIQEYPVPRGKTLLEAVRKAINGSRGPILSASQAMASLSSYDPSEDFVGLRSKWGKASALLSSPKAKSMIPEYQRIIGMGKSAVPLILDDLATNGPDHWFWALQAITGENPVCESQIGNMEAMTKAWIEWGIHQGYPIAFPQTQKKRSRTSKPR